MYWYTSYVPGTCCDHACAFLLNCRPSSRAFFFFFLETFHAEGFMPGLPFGGVTAVKSFYCAMHLYRDKSHMHYFFGWAILPPHLLFYA